MRNDFVGSLFPFLPRRSIGFGRIVNNAWLPKREVAIEYDTIYTIISTGEKFSIITSETVLYLHVGTRSPYEIRVEKPVQCGMKNSIH